MNTFVACLLFAIAQLITNQSIQNPSCSFQNPLHESCVVTGCFAELRVGHFHSGLDLRTDVGKPVFAAADGYVSQIRSLKVGYGNCLFLTHKNGMVTVYGHLNAFRSDIAARAAAVIDSTFSTDLVYDCSKNEFPVKAGDLIAFSGNTGFSGGPHLHFEIRSDSGKVYRNPQLYCPQKDSQKPIITALSIYADGYNGFLENDLPFKTVKISTQNSLLPMFNVEACGSVYVGAESFDIPDDSPCSCNAPYQLEFFCNNVLFSKITFTEIPVDQTRAVNAITDYKQRIINGNRIMISKKLPGNPLNIYSDLQNDGCINILPGKTYDIKIVSHDYAGNSTESHFNITGVESDYRVNIIAENPVDCLKDFNLIRGSLQISFPKGSLYDNFDCKIIKEPVSKTAYGDTYTIHTPEVALHDSITVKIKINNFSQNLKNKYCLSELISKNRVKYCGGKVNDGFVCAKTNEFGTFYVDIDTAGPVIKLNKKLFYRRNAAAAVDVKCFDKISPVKDFKMYLNNQRVVVDYNYKTAIYTGLKKVEPGEYTLKVEAEDSNENVSILEEMITIR